MSRALRIGAGLVLALSILTCTDERVVGPRRPGAVALDLRSLTAPPAPGLPDIPIDSIRLTLRRPAAITAALDTVFRVRRDTVVDALKLQLDVPLNDSPEDFLVEVYAYGANVLWYRLSTSVTLTAGSTATPPPFTAQYVGPGYNAKAVLVQPRDTSALGGAPFALHALVTDSSDAPIAGVPVGYRLGNATRGSVSVTYLTATFTGADTVRDSVWLVAETPTHLRDSTRVHLRPPPTQIQSISGNGQSGTVGVPLGPDSVRVLDKLGAAFPGDTVVWAVTVGGASLSATKTATDSNGYAAVVPTPTAAGPLTVQASVAGLTGSPVSFTATAVSTAATNVARVSGDAQTDTVGKTLAAPFVVIVTNAGSNPVPNTKVAWSVVHGAGTPSPDTSTTDGAGHAQTSFTLGQLAGADSVRATVVGTALTTTFGAAALHARASKLTIVSGNAQTDTVNRLLGQPLIVAVGDTFNNGFAGDTVTWALVTGSGTLSADTTIADAVGHASVTFQLGAAPGIDSIRAALVGTTKTATFAVTAISGGVSQVVLDRVNDTIPLGDSLQYTATLKDSAGNTVPGTVTWTSNTPAVASVNASGLAHGLSGGLTRIIATKGAKADTALLYVKGLTTIAVSPADTVITAIGDSVLLKAVGLDNFGDTVPGLTIRFSSATPTVATVNAITGRVHLIGAGNGVVIARDSVSTKQGTASLHVNQVAFGIVNTPPLPDSLQVGVNGRGQIVAKALDRNNYPIPGATFGFVSRAPATATVNSTGLVTGVALGDAYVIDSLVDSVTGLHKDSVLVAVVVTPPPLIQWAFDSVAIGNGGNLSVALSLSRTDASPLIVKLASSDTLIAKPTVKTVSFSPGTANTSVVISGLQAGRVTLVASDSSGLGFQPDTMVVTVVSTIEFREIGSFSQQPNFYVNRNETHQAQVFLSDPAPAGGLGVTFVYKSGNAIVTPAPAIIPAGQLAANVVITGVTTGSDSVVPTSGGFVGRFSRVTIAPNNLGLALPYPYTGVLGVGQSFQPYVYITYGMDHPLFVTNSLAPAIGAVSPTDTIFANQTSVYLTVQANALGQSQLTVSAPGWNPDSLPLHFSTPRLAASGTTSIIAGDPSRGSWSVSTEDSTQYSHPVVSPLHVTAISRDTNIVAVDDTAATVTAGNSYASVANALRAKPTAGGDTTWIVLTAPGYQSDSFRVIVAKPTLTLNLNYPYDGRVALGTRFANVATVQIPYARPDTFWIVFSHSRGGRVGHPAVDSIAIPKGLTYAYDTIVGDTLGQDSASVTRATGYVVSGSPLVFTVDSLHVRPYSYPSTLYTISTPQQVSMAAYDAVNNQYRPLTAPLTVNVTSSKPTTFTLDFANVTIPAGNYLSNYDTLRIVGVDSVGGRILTTAAGSSPDSSGPIKVYATPLSIQFGYPYQVGRGLKLQNNYVYVTGGNVPDTVKVALAHTNPAADSLMADTVVIRKGVSTSTYFEIRALDSTGTDTIIATAPGYVLSKVTISPMASRLDVSEPGANHQTTDAPSRLITYTETANGYGLKPSAPLTFSVTTSNPSVIQIDSALTVNGPSDSGTSVVDTALSYGYFRIRYVGSGTARIYVRAPGFATDSTQLVTVTGPTLHVAYTTLTLGTGQIFPSQYVYVDNAITGSPLIVHLAKSDSTLPPGNQAFTLAADSAVIPIGQSSSPAFDITGQALGSANLIARANGYSQAIATVSVVQTKLSANYTSLNLNVGQAPSRVYINTQDVNGSNHIVAAALVVSDSSSDSTVSKGDSSSRTIVTRSGQTYFDFSGLRKGAVNVVFSAPGYLPDTMTVSVDTAPLTLYNPPNGLGPGQLSTNDMYVSIPRATAAPLTVFLKSSNPAVALVPTSVTIPANGTYAYIPVTGTGLGLATISDSAPGQALASAPVNVRVSTPALLVSISTNQNAGQKYGFTVYTRDSLGSYRIVADTVAVTLSATNPAHAAFDSTAIHVQPGLDYAISGVAFDTAGTYTVTAQAPGYASGSAVVTVTGAQVTISDFQFAPQTVTIPAGHYVTWRNTGPSAHTTLSDTNIWNSGTMNAGDTYSHFFGAAGTFSYHCAIHPGMTATVIVQ